MATKSQRLTRERNWCIYMLRGMLAITESYFARHVETTALQIALTQVLYALQSLQYRRTRQ
jgi:uncharacterized membrane protein